jgi:hypothetical protein
MYLASLRKDSRFTSDADEFAADNPCYIKHYTKLPYDFQIQPISLIFHVNTVVNRIMIAILL